MARAKISEGGAVELPGDLRSAIGLEPGDEVEITERAGRIIVMPVSSVGAETMMERKLKVEEFLAKRILYDGPPITEDLINQAVLDEAKRRWEKVQRQWSEGADEDPVD